MIFVLIFINQDIEKDKRSPAKVTKQIQQILYS